jgi:hypothetical protein
MTTPTSPELLDLLKKFASDHPEVVAELVKEAEAAVPPSLYEVVHAAVEMIRGVDDVRRTELHAAVDRHQAEHEALVAAVKPGVPSDPETPEPAPAPAPPAPPVPDPGGPAPSMSYTGPPGGPDAG